MALLIVGAPPKAEAESLNSSSLVTGSLELVRTQDFIRELFYITKEDAETKLEPEMRIAARRKYFTKSAWSEYEEYVQSERDNITKLNKEDRTLDKTNVQFVNIFKFYSERTGTIPYAKFSKDEQGLYTFTAQGQHLYGQFDILFYLGLKFTTTIIFSGDLNNPRSILIKKWDVSNFEKDKN